MPPSGAREMMRVRFDCVFEIKRGSGMAPGGWRGTQSERRALEGGSVLQGTVGGPSFSQQFLGLHDHSGNRRASSLVALFLVVQEIRHQNTSVGPDHPVWNLALVKQPNE